VVYPDSIASLQEQPTDGCTRKIAELEINPLMELSGSNEVVAVDALVVM
jgi:hypothetical protein